MIKNKSLKVGLLVFILTLIGLIALAEFYPDNNLDEVGNKSETTNTTTNQQLEIAKQ